MSIMEVFIKNRKEIFSVRDFLFFYAGLNFASNILYKFYLFFFKFKIIDLVLQNLYKLLN